MTTSFITSLAYCDPAPFALAVIEVYHTNQAHGPLLGMPADAGAWIFDQQTRERLHANVVAAWGRITKRSYDWFPFSIDIVARLYWRVAKAKPSQVDAWEAELAA